MIRVRGLAAMDRDNGPETRPRAKPSRACNPKPTNRSEETSPFMTERGQKRPQEFKPIAKPATTLWCWVQLRFLRM